MPTKALASDEGLEFEFFLAQKLGRTVAELRGALSTSEFIYWQMYYARIAQRQEIDDKKAKRKRSGRRR